MKKLLVLMIPASQILLVVGYICSQQKLDLWGPIRNTDIPDSGWCSFL